MPTQTRFDDSGTSPEVHLTIEAAFGPCEIKFFWRCDRRSNNAARGYVQWVFRDIGSEFKGGFNGGDVYNLSRPSATGLVKVVAFFGNAKAGMVEISRYAESELDTMPGDAVVMGGLIMVKR